MSNETQQKIEEPVAKPKKKKPFTVKNSAKGLIIINLTKAEYEKDGKTFKGTAAGFRKNLLPGKTLDIDTVYKAQFERSYATELKIKSLVIL